MEAAAAGAQTVAAMCFAEAEGLVVEAVPECSGSCGGKVVVAELGRGR